MRTCAVFLLLLLCTLNAAAQDISQADFSGLAPITADNAAQITELARYGDGVFGSSLAWSPDGETLAVAGSLGVWLYDTDDFSTPPRLLEHEASVQDVAWSPDGETLATIGRGVHLWNVANNTHTLLTGGEGALAFSPDGTMLAVGGSSGDGYGWYWATVNLVEVATGDTLATMESDGSSRITDLAFSSDGSLLAATSSANGDWSGCYVDTIQGLQVWNVAEVIQKGQVSIQETLFDLRQSGFNVAFSVDGLMSSNPPHGITLWSTETGEALSSMAEGNIVEVLAYSGSLVAASTQDDTGADDLRIFDMETREQLAEFTSQWMWDLAFSLDGKTLAGVERGALRLWDVSDAARITEFDNVALLPTLDDILARINADAALFEQVEPRTDQWQTSEGHTMQAIYNPAETMLAYKNTTYGWAEVYLRDVPTILDLPLGWEGELNDNVGEMIFSPDGKYFAFMVEGWHGCGMGATYDLYIWDVSSGVEAASQVAHLETVPVVDLAFSPDGSVLAGATESSIFLWDASIGAVLVPYLYGHRGAVYSVAFSTDGTLLLSEGGAVYSVAFSTDGTLLLSEGADGTVRLWGIPR